MQSIRDLDQKDIIWVAIGTLLATMFVLVAYQQLVNLHFSAWQLYPKHESTEPFAQLVRDPIVGWYRLVAVVLTFLAGGAATARTIAGAWKMLALLLGSLLLTIVAIEATQNLGQDTTPVSQIDHVAPTSVVLAAIIGVVPLTVLLLSLRRPTTGH